ncbi:MAG: hypothetical protein KDB04_05120 [Acidimicrobiales bacterium]|nr:hypothetical protein [Acidimicrobiales bacterium]
MEVGPPHEVDGGIGLEVRSDAVDAARRAVHVRMADARLPATSDASLVAGLLLAMRRGEPLRIPGPVDAGLRARSDEVQAIFATWDRALRPTSRWYRRVPVEAAEATSPTTAGPTAATAAFFTGGVDSFHTALRHRDRLDLLVYVHGFDVALDDVDLRRRVSAHLRAAADDLGIELLEIESDLQALGDAHGVGWPDYHGAALATVAHLLAPRVGRVLVPATHTYAHLEGLGSHPLVDRLWSSAAMEVVHDGADATRADKLRAIADEPTARRHLRVCWENRDGAYNCGQCEKCVRTGVAVRVAGVEGAFPTIPAPSLAQVARVRATGRGSPWSELRDELAATGASPRLRAATDLVLARRQLARWAWTRRWFA